jgi:hypothetical protein
VVQWSKEGLLDHIMALIVTYDVVGCTALRCTAALPGLGTSDPSWFVLQPFTIIDWPYFRALLQFQRPATKETDIPHRTAVSQKMFEAASGVEQRIKERYQVRCCFIALHCIAWLWILSDLLPAATIGGAWQYFSRV